MRRVTNKSKHLLLLKSPLSLLLVSQLLNQYKSHKHKIPMRKVMTHPLLSQSRDNPLNHSYKLNSLLLLLSSPLKSNSKQIQTRKKVTSLFSFLPRTNPNLASKLKSQLSPNNPKSNQSKLRKKAAMRTFPHPKMVKSQAKSQLFKQSSHKLRPPSESLFKENLKLRLHKIPMKRNQMKHHHQRNPLFNNKSPAKSPLLKLLSQLLRFNPREKPKLRKTLMSQMKHHSP